MQPELAEVRDFLARHARYHAHDALVDALYCAELLLAQLSRFGRTPTRRLLRRGLR